MTDIEQRAISVIRGIAMDAPQKANSGHPGTAMALAPLAHVLWTRIMTYDPSAPHWPDRDRFVLSCGHVSILQYAMLFLAGYGLTIDDLKQFRQWRSRTPGHPENELTTGVEVTTGPLGQGLSNAIGMAMAERWLRARFGPELVDHRVFTIVSDGDLMEGISHEAASFAGHQELGRLIAVYDDNHITIDGPTELALTDDAAKRFEAYGWRTDVLGEEANDLDALEAAIRRAMEDDERPSLLVLRSHIGYPAPRMTDKAAAHGSPFGEEEVRATKELLGLPPDDTFFAPDDVVSWYREVCARGAAARQAWEQRFSGMDSDRTEWDACWGTSSGVGSTGLAGWTASLPRWDTPGEMVATRHAGATVLNAIAGVVPGLVGGGADLTGNTGAALDGHGTQADDSPEGRLVHFGVREHGMGGIMNGMALHGGVLPFGGTFFIFSDYMRGSVRLAALSGAKVVYSWSHDSIGVGEDGPTHQPIEHLASLRAMPGLRLIRPADANETAQAWRIAVESTGPTAIVLTRQAVPVLARTAELDAVSRGGYVLVDSDGQPDLVLVGTGSEVHVCVDAAGQLAAEGVACRVVSLPSWDLFAAQGEEYRRTVLPAHVPTLAVEAGTTFGWDRYADDAVGIDHFGASAPGAVLFEQFGITPQSVAERARALLARTEQEAHA